jgi:hypothetical protein
VVEAIVSARTPLVLLVIAALLLGYVLLFERGRPGQTETEARKGLLVEGLVRGRITRIRVGSGDRGTVLRREGEGFDETWTIEGPEASPADSEKVEDYVRNWEFAVPVRTLESPSPEDRTLFGLDSPRGEVTFEMGQAAVRVTLASGAPVDGGGYVQIDDERAVSVVGKDVVSLFERTPDSFAAKTNAPTLEDLDEESP